MSEDFNTINTKSDGFKEAIVSESSDLKQSNLTEDESVKISADSEPVPDKGKVGVDSEQGLPPDVTEAPRDREHMDLEKVKPYAKWLRTYLSVSDDEGDFLGNKVLEKEVKKLCKQLSVLDLTQVETPDLWIGTIKDTLARYASMVNRSENCSIGIVTKYRIRQGTLLIHQKTLVTKRLQRNWIEWFNENYDPSLLRSSQDYMRIAAIPNAIKYSVFGKERLLSIIRQLSETESEDPIGEFLTKNGIDFSPDVENDPEEIRLKADIAINCQRLTKENLGEIPREKIEAFVGAGNEIGAKHIRELKLVKQTAGDLNGYMDALIASGGKPEPVMTPERKAESYKNTLVAFLKKTKDAISDTQYIEHIDIQLCRELKEQIEQLERHISSRQSS